MLQLNYNSSHYNISMVLDCQAGPRVKQLDYLGQHQLGIQCWWSPNTCAYVSEVDFGPLPTARHMLLTHHRIPQR